MLILQKLQNSQCE